MVHRHRVRACRSPPLRAGAEGAHALEEETRIQGTQATTSEKPTINEAALCSASLTPITIGRPIQDPSNAM